jgi:hypothetical protein
MHRRNLTLTTMRLWRARVAGCHAKGLARAAGEGAAEEGAEGAALFRARLLHEASAWASGGPTEGRRLAACLGRWRASSCAASHVAERLSKNISRDFFSKFCTPKT